MSRQTIQEVTWLELFYDLIFIAAVIQLGSLLSHHLNGAGLLKFVVLFVLIWWPWHNTALYFNRCAVDTVPRRLLVFAQIFCLGNLATVVGGAFTDAATQFSLFYSVIRLGLVLLYMQMGRQESQLGRLVKRYVVGFGVGTVLWFISAWLAPPSRYVFWVLALLSDSYAVFSTVSRQQARKLPLDVPRLSERYGQFTLIVLGESFIKTIGGVAEQGLSVSSVLFSALAFIPIASVWWSYFDKLSVTLISLSRTQLWAYLHLPLTLSIAAMGVALQKVVLLTPGDGLEAPARTLLYGSLIGIIATLIVIDLITTETNSARYLRVRLTSHALGIAGLAALIGLGDAIPSLVSLLLAVGIILLQPAAEVLRGTWAASEVRATRRNEL